MGTEEHINVVVRIIPIWTETVGQIPSLAQAHKCYYEYQNRLATPSRSDIHNSFVYTSIQNVAHKEHNPCRL
jgi:hypothetical protein